mgnify:FL=1
MSKKWYIIYAVAIVLLPLFLLMVVRLESPSEIIVPPGFYGETAEVQDAFEASLSANNRNNITLKYPTDGEYRSAFVMNNLDSDSDEEVIVFYTLKSDESTVRMNVLDKIEDKWQSVYDEPGYGSEVISVVFDDLNKDGDTEIICSWSLYESQSSKVMTIHSAHTEKAKPIELKTLVSQSYSFSGLADFDSDGFDEILIIWTDSSNVSNVGAVLPKTSAILLKMTEDDTISPLGQPVTMDSSVSAYGDMHLQTSKDSDRLIAFLDAYKGEDTMITEVLWWDPVKYTLVAPFFDPVTLSNTATLRSPAVPASDIDEDGTIEIPVNWQNTALEQGPITPDDDSGSMQQVGKQVNLTTWMNVVQGGLVPKSYSFINCTAGYSFTVPNKTAESLVAYTTDTGVMTIYTSTDGVAYDEPLFSLVMKKRDEITEKDTYTFKRTSDDYVVFGTLTGAGESFGFTNELINKSIVIYDKGV